MTTEDSLWQVLRQVHALPFGAGQIAAVEELIAQADAARLPELEFAARMLATNAYTYGGEPAKAFVTFSWCLSDFDRNPGHHTGADAHTLLWHFKYMVTALTKFPDVPLDRTYEVLDDMERRYRDGGHSLYAVYSLRHLVARHVGDEEAAQRWYDSWTAARRDELSDCAGCDPSRRVAYLSSRGRDAEAVALAEPVLAGRLTCSEQPHGMLTTLLYPYLRTGRHDEAADAHRRAYRSHRQHLADLADIGEHMEFCALTGNAPRGLEILERHLTWLERAPSPYAAMEFASAGALVLRRLADDGRGDEPVRSATTVAEFAAELARTGTDLARRFDARNGTTFQGDRIARRVAAEPLVDYLPLSATARRRAAQSAPAPPPPATPPRIPAGASAEDLLELAEEHARHGRMPAAIQVWQTFDDRFGGTELDLVCAGRRADGHGHERAEAGDLAGAESQWWRAAGIFDQAGDETRRQVALGKIGVTRCMAGRADEAADLIEESTAYLLANANPSRQAGALSRLAILRLAQERFADALAALEDAAERAGETELAGFLAELAVRRAECLALLGRADELRAAAAAAREQARGVDSAALAGAALLHGGALMEDQEFRAALAAFDEALAAADDPEVRLNARLGRARALRALDRPADAIDELIEVVAGCAELDADEGGAFTRFELAQAYRQAGRLSEAVEVAEEALLALDQLGAQDETDRCRYLLATLYRDLGDPEPALALLDTVAANLDGFDNLPARAQMYEEAGDVLYRLDRDGEAAGRYEAAASAYHRAGLPVDEVRARRRCALALRWSGQTDAALAELAEADRLVGRLPAEADAPEVIWERAMTAYEGARLLLGLDQVAEALARMRGVPDQFRSIDAYSEGVLAELLHGELLLRSDRPADAEPVLRAALVGLPRDADPVSHAAWLLAEALSALGRDAEAGALRAEYGVEDD